MYLGTQHFPFLLNPFDQLSPWTLSILITSHKHRHQTSRKFRKKSLPRHRIDSLPVYVKQPSTYLPQSASPTGIRTVHGTLQPLHQPFDIIATMTRYGMDKEDYDKLRAPLSVPHELRDGFFDVREKLEAVHAQATIEYSKMLAVVRKVTEHCKDTLAKLADLKKEYDDILANYAASSDHPLVPLYAHDFNYKVKWDDCLTVPHFTNSANGFRVDVQPLEDNQPHYDNWLKRIQDGTTHFGESGLPNDPAGIFPQPQPAGSVESPNQDQPEVQPQEQEKKQQQSEQHDEQKQPGSTEPNPSQPLPTTTASLEPTLTSVSPSAPASAIEGQSDTRPQPTKLDKGKGKAIDVPSSNTTTTTRSTIDISPAALAGPSNTGNSTAKDDNANIGNTPIQQNSTDTGTTNTGTTNTDSTIIVATTINDDATNSEDELALGQENEDNDSDSGNETDDSKDSNFTITSKTSKKRKAPTAAPEESHESPRKRLRVRATRSATQGDTQDKGKAVEEPQPSNTDNVSSTSNKKDVKGKGKAVDRAPSNRITKPKDSKQRAAGVAKHQTIKRLDVVKGKYWVFKMDSSMFTQNGSVSAKYSNGNSNGSTKSTVKDNGEGSSKTATTSTTTTTAMATASVSDSSTATSANASVSGPSSNKRKRTIDDTGDDQEDDKKDAYYVLRCPLEDNCMADANNSPFTHSDPAGLKGIFHRHPFKKRRAINHIKECKLQGQIKSEKEIFERHCKRGEFFFFPFVFFQVLEGGLKKKIEC